MKVALRPIVTARPYEYPFAEALIQYVQEAAATRPEWMTPERRNTILTMLPPAKDIFELHNGDKVTVGINQDHPYIQEYLALRNAGYDADARAVVAARINPFAPIDSVRLPLGLNVECVHNARIVQEIRDDLSKLFSQRSDEAGFDYYLDRYSLVDRTAGREHHSKKESD